MTEHEELGEIKSSFTFETEEAARAFLCGWRTGRTDGIYASVDPEEPQSLSVDFVETDAWTPEESEKILNEAKAEFGFSEKKNQCI